MVEQTVPGVLIRRLQQHESGLYRALRLASLRDAPDDFGSTYEEEARLPKLKFEAFIEQGGYERFMFGAFAQGGLVGMVGFERFERQRTRHRGELVQMYVQASQRGQGTGEKLLRAVVERAFSLPDLEQLQLGVMAGNRAAIGLYEKVGFRTFAAQPRYFKVSQGYKDQQFMQLFKDKYRSGLSPEPSSR